MRFILKLVILELVYVTVKEFKRARLITWDGPPMVITTINVVPRARKLSGVWHMEPGELECYVSDEVLEMLKEAKE